ncbi:hypothetical protein AG0111_0g10807 [Alternaria gaisen]|uniref:Uncharacterized protein n=1 Tax=Alternaria gaisen TaxID=167740 RepID=A0ACB6F808_9PLEO|nr:hypothetical protein AG0111_0g10807 [Alternaria gaisen]
MSKDLRTPRATSALIATIKRKPDVIDLESYEERAVKKPFIPVIKSPALREEDMLFQISVTVNSKIDVFPQKLREALQKSYQTACYTHMFALQAGATPKHHQIYNIVKGERTRSESVTFTNTIVQHNIFDLGMANIRLLGILTDASRDKLDKRTFVELKTESGLLNPEFIELHSVRHREIGWGFDADGCLSLYGTFVIEKKLKEKVWYVTTGEIKLEDEA